MRTGIWKGQISFGLLNIPVNLQSAYEDKELHFSLLDKKDFSLIKYKRINAITKKEVPYDRIVKAYKFENGEYVVLSSADFQAANIKATQSIDIQDFVKLQEIDTMLFEKPYYIVPQKGGEKAYGLLREALLKTKKVAIAKIVLRTKQHLVAIFPKERYLILELLRFSHLVKEVHEADYSVPKQSSHYPEKELKMAINLVEQMSNKWNPSKYKDTYYKDLMKRIKQKSKARKSNIIVKTKEKEEKINAVGSENILKLLKESLSDKQKKNTKANSRRKLHAAA